MTVKTNDNLTFVSNSGDNGEFGWRYEWRGFQVFAQRNKGMHWGPYGPFCSFQVMISKGLATYLTADYDTGATEEELEEDEEVEAEAIVARALEDLQANLCPQCENNYVEQGSKDYICHRCRYGV